MKAAAPLLAAALLAGAARGVVDGGGRFVSMGSSYAAGPSVGRPDQAAGDCQRSLSNYARLVAYHPNQAAMAKLATALEAAIGR